MHEVECHLVVRGEWKVYYISISRSFDIGAVEQFVKAQNLELNHGDISDGKFILLKEEGIVKGMIGLEPCGEYGLLRSFLFKPEAQAQIPALFETILALAKEKRLKKIFLISNKLQALGFFEALQFERINSREIPEDLRTSSIVEKVWTINEAYVMERAL